MAPEKSTRRLGRGLDALFNAPGTSTSEEKESALREIPLTQIASNPFQPRRTFGEEELRELSESLRKNGLLQPVTVRPAPNGTGFELIAGERRLRAATLLSWPTIPAVVKKMSDKEILTLALVENLQRSDLDPIEEAEGYQRLIGEFGHTQQTVSEMVGKDRSTVANVLRVLNLPTDVREMIRAGKLTAGQARPLLSLEDPTRISSLARQVVKDGLSARDVERRVREAPADATRGKKRGRPSNADDRSPEVRDIEQRLRKYLQTDVSIVLKARKRGSVVIDFYSADDLERLIELIGLAENPQ